MKPNDSKAYLKPVTTSTEINELAQIATKIWHEHFKDILSAEQIEYMVENFQSQKAMTRQINHEGYTYQAICFDNQVAGYIAYVLKPNEPIFLSKLYLQKDFRGKGLARLGFNSLIDTAQKNGVKSIFLTVNKYNSTTIDIYKKMGFVITDTRVKDIGGGFVMDDYIMTFEL